VPDRWPAYGLPLDLWQGNSNTTPLVAEMAALILQARPGLNGGGGRSVEAHGIGARQWTVDSQGWESGRRNTVSGRGTRIWGPLLKLDVKRVVDTNQFCYSQIPHDLSTQSFY